ncbi:hypothetical protein KFE25_001731 [Diacronema lutheri]|uniref:Phosphorylated adapter RNA export protein n=1 Tax=Diacronema lutheri TaxID=2081491 RepID=A0A8J5XFB7_DIALT|nr:hypothetical protein KFE25_001731 [Diacronema lutheri]
MEGLSGALQELDHAFGGAAYASRRACTPAVHRSAVPYDGVEPAPELAPPRPARPPYPAKRAAGPAHADKKRVERVLPRWVDLDDASAILDPATLLAARKKPHNAPAGGGEDGAGGGDGAGDGPAAGVDGAHAAAAAAEPDPHADFERLLQTHVGSRREGDRRSSAPADDADLEPNLTPAGEEIDGATRNVARLVAARLDEAMRDAQRTIERILALLGTEKVLELLERAESTDTSGGLITHDGTRRRRTRGGVFFYFVKQMTNRKEKAYLWPASQQPGGGIDTRGGGGGARGEERAERGRCANGRARWPPSHNRQFPRAPRLPLGPDALRL